MTECHVCTVPRYCELTLTTIHNLYRAFRHFRFKSLVWGSLGLTPTEPCLLYAVVALSKSQRPSLPVALVYRPSSASCFVTRLKENTSLDVVVCAPHQPAGQSDKEIVDEYFIKDSSVRQAQVWQTVVATCTLYVSLIPRPQRCLGMRLRRFVFMFPFSSWWTGWRGMPCQTWRVSRPRSITLLTLWPGRTRCWTFRVASTRDTLSLKW